MLPLFCFLHIFPPKKLSGDKHGRFEIIFIYMPHIICVIFQF